MLSRRDEIVKNYIKSYNRFDVDGMVENLAPTIRFTNIADDEETLTLDGLEAFRAQAIQAVGLFSEREQTIRSIKHTGDEMEVTIGYRGILAVDLPNGLKRGDELRLLGQSIFTFNAQNQITKLKDIS